MNTRSCVFLLVLGSTLSAVVGRAEEVTIPLTGLQGYYGLGASRTVEVDAGVIFQCVDGARIEWAGEVAAGYGWEDGPECPGRYVVEPGRFYAYLFDGGFRASAEGPALGYATYPYPEPFDTASPFHLGIGGTWEFLWDGRCECRVDFFLAYPYGWCTLDLYDYPWGSLDSVRLVIVGLRAGDLDADGDVDLADFSIFVGCMAGPEATSPPPGCDPTDFANADLDHDGDVDLADFAVFQPVFNGS